MAEYITWAEKLLTSQSYADQYLQDYEMICEDEQGREGCYHPTEREMIVVSDAVNGLIADEEFCALVAKEYAERRARREAEGCCPGCGCPKDQGHWGLHCKG